ncbi:MAG: hypothetical protein HND56_04735 [Pseudomonadota bacterium]|nr:hypothetical protein [Pseudomonadota bacterium]QKK05038.1 MAG: hypothetical protein HND56_04735 [Pseudomonadota bacterium]
MTEGFEDWTEWKPDWTIPVKEKKRRKGQEKRCQTPHDFQEKLSPTLPVRQNLGGGRSTVQHRRRIVDARLWDAMSPFQQNAAMALEQACYLLSRGLGYRISAPHKLNTGKTHFKETDRDAEKIAVYSQWVKKCKEQNCHHSAAMDILAFGKSCREVDRARKCRNGWARGNLFTCLDIYCQIRGWPIGA